MSIKDTFSHTALDYDRDRRRLIPCFDPFYAAAVACLPFDPGAALKFLDLGAGTGLLSAFILARFPRARITLIDLSEEMLAIARQRLAGADRVAFQAADYGRMALPGAVDAIVSALSIHHLDHAEKRVLFGRIHAALRPGGVFVNAEQTTAPTPTGQARILSRWEKEARAAGISETGLEQARERMRYDQCATLADQLTWLNEAGFNQVRSPFASGMFAVYMGKK